MAMGSHAGVFKRNSCKFGDRNTLRPNIFMTLFKSSCAAILEYIRPDN
jgi:hypothetical protein